MQCYEAQGNWEFLILMHLNGEGVPADVQKAEVLFHAWQQATPCPNEWGESLQMKALRKAIEARKAHPQQSYPRLDYCTDIAGDTPTLNFCAWIDERIAETRFQTTLATIKAKLTIAETTVFDKVVAAFNAYRYAERQRMYQQYIDGSIRNLAAFSQAGFVREQFLKLIRETVEQRRLTPADHKAYKVADDELNQVYRAGIREYTESYENLLESDYFKKYHDKYKGYIEDYKQLSKTAQESWIKYRDMCVELARVLYKDKTREFDPAVSMKTAVTKMRVVELRNDPVCPES